MITFTHLEFGWYLLCYSLLWILVVIGACWVTRAITLDRAAAAEFATQERKAGGRHRLIPDDSGRPLAKPDTIPLARLRVNFATGPAEIRQCSYCGFGVQLAPDGKACKSGSACPFSGQTVRYISLPPGAQPPLRELVGRTTDQIALWEADTDRFIAAMRGET